MKLKEKYRLLIFALLGFISGVPNYAQVNAGPDVTISAGLPVRLSATYEGYVGNPITATDDAFVGPFDIGFSFNFYDEMFTQFAISPNGVVSFDVPAIIGSAYYQDAITIPSPSKWFKKSILAPYHDLFQKTVAAHSNFLYYLTVGETPDRRLIIGWCNAPMYNCPSSLATYQLVLNESDNSIVNHIISKPCCHESENFSTQGLNFSNDFGLAVPGRNATEWTAEGETWRYEYNGGTNYTVTEVDFAPEVIVPQGGLSWAWYQGSYPGGDFLGSSESIDVQPLETTSYFCEITLCGGVKYVDEIKVTAIPIPNAFNPNSPSEVNRSLKVFANPADNINGFAMYIYNRWGQKVFKTNVLDQGWDGTENGSESPAGVYVGTIYYNGEGGVMTNKGTVTLVR